MSFASPADSAVVTAPRWSDLYLSVIAKAISNGGDILAADRQAEGCSGIGQLLDLVGEQRRGRGQRLQRREQAIGATSTEDDGLRGGETAVAGAAVRG